MITGGKTGEVIVNFPVDKNSRPKEKPEIIEIYKEFQKYLRLFIEQAATERHLWNHYGEKIDTSYKAAIAHF